MSNKQSMKLYTEEQLIQAFKSGMSACMKHKDWALAINYPNKIELLEYMQSLTPIELPSDEEIKNEIGYDWFDPEDIAFFGGIDYLRSKIQGGNNEQH